MKKRDWSDCKLTIGCPGDEDSIIIPIHGEKETDINKIMKNIYKRWDDDVFYDEMKLIKDRKNELLEDYER